MSEIDPRLDQAFEALRAECAATPPRPEAMRTARAAMHQARATRPAVGGLALFGERLRQALTPRRLGVAGGGVVAGLAVVAALGWNAPAGSPLHGVRVAHEQLSLVLPGSDRVGLDLGFAESRLHEVEKGQGSSSALDEAQRLLDDARQHLTASSPQWKRWRDDESLLGRLRQRGEEETQQGPSGGDDGGSGGGTESSSGTTSDDHGGSTSTSTGGGGGDGGSSSSSTSTEQHESTTTTTTTTTTQSSSSTSSHEGGGSSSSSSSSSTSTSGGGGGSDGGGGGSGG